MKENAYEWGIEICECGTMLGILDNQWVCGNCKEFKGDSLHEPKTVANVDSHGDR